MTRKKTEIKACNRCVEFERNLKSNGIFAASIICMGTNNPETDCFFWSDAFDD